MTDTRTFTTAEIVDFKFSNCQLDVEHKISGLRKIEPEPKLRKIIAVYEHHFCQTHINQIGCEFWSKTSIIIQ